MSTTDSDAKISVVPEVFSFINFDSGEIADVVRAIERGRLKIRVRALEAERALERVQVMQGLMLKMMVACAACNVGVVLYVSGMLLQAKGVFGVAGLFAMQALVAQMKLGKLIKKEAQYAGAA